MYIYRRCDTYSFTDLLRRGPTRDDLLNRVKQEGLMAGSRMCCNNVCVWQHGSGVDGWRWRCNGQKSSVVFDPAKIYGEYLLLEYLVSLKIVKADNCDKISAQYKCLRTEFTPFMKNKRSYMNCNLAFALGNPCTDSYDRGQKICPRLWNSRGT